VIFFELLKKLFPNAGQMQDENALVSLNLFFLVLLIRKDFS